MRNPIQLIKDSVAILKENLKLLAGVALVPIIFSYLVEYLAPVNSGVFNVAEWSIYSVLMLVSIVLNILMAAAIIYAIHDRSLTIISAYKQALGKFWQYLGLSILTSVILFVGFLLLVVPGIIMSVWFSFAAFVLVLENKTIIGSLKASREYVRGKWWGVFGRIIAGSLLMTVTILIVMIPIVLIFGEAISNVIALVIAVAVTPVAVGYIYLLYQDIKGAGVTATADTSIAPTGPQTAGSASAGATAETTQPQSEHGSGL